MAKLIITARLLLPLYVLACYVGWLLTPVEFLFLSDVFKISFYFMFHVFIIDLMMGVIEKIAHLMAGVEND